VIRAVVRRCAWPTIIGTNLLLAWWGLQTGWDHGSLVGMLSVGVAVPVLILQRLLPYESTWRGWHVDLVTDLLHTVFSMGAATELVKALLFGSIVWASAQLSHLLGMTLWPTYLPLFVQLPLALLIGELMTYTLHRASHEHPLLWRIHALHHSSERLYMLSGGRNHPISTALAYALGTLPLILMGAHAEILVLTAVFTATNGMLQHANIDYVFGPLNWVISTADLHRWHHSEVVHESCSNYGSNLIVWDVLFGTRFLPADRRISKVGLGPDSDFPNDFVGHLMSPFTMRV